MAEERGFTTVAELGVQSGRFADMFLYVAPSITKYTLVDTWAKQANYNDSGNVDNSVHEALYQETMTRLKPYVDAGTRNLKLFPIRNFTSSAVLQVEDESFDFIYVDARHDYCGAKEDIENWYPKLKVGGIMAGDDYLTDKEHIAMKGGKYDPNDDWSICLDRSRHEGAVKGAVKQFAKKHGIKVYTTWKHDITNKERLQWPQWIYSRKLASGTGAGTSTGSGTKIRATSIADGQKGRGEGK